MAQLSFLTYLRGIYKLNLNRSGKVHYAIIQSIYDCFVMARDDIDLARLEMCLSSATGHWLDSWGEYFGVYRKAGETDEYYSKRIIKEVISPKCTIPSIKDHIVDFLNEKYDKNYTREDVLIKEPWREIAKYSHKGALSKDAKFFSSDYYCHAILDINIPEEVTSDLVDLVKAVKAAGVQTIWSIFNSYDIVTGFNTADDAWAAYHRWLQTETKRMQNTGFVLSYGGATLSGNTSGGMEKPPHCVSGSRQIWALLDSVYQWYAKVLEKETDKSVIITKKDLIGVIDYYKNIEEIYGTDLDALKVSVDGTLSTDKKVSGSQRTPKRIEHLVKIGDECLKTLELLDTFLTLSYEGRLSTKDGVMLQYTAEHELFGKLMEELDRFKNQNLDYYNALQPPILTGDRVMWLVTRNKNWLWNTPTMTHEDFYKLWEPYGDYEEHTINSITEFEDAYYQGYITFGDQYQPPVVIGDKFRWTPQMVQDWLYNSPAFHVSDLQDVYRRQFNRLYGKVDYPDFDILDIEQLEASMFEKYSVAKNAQPPIMITPLPQPNPYDVIIGYNNTAQVYSIYNRDHTYSSLKKPRMTLSLSETTDRAMLSGKPQMIFRDINTELMYSGITIKDRDADTSVTVSRKDLMNILDFYNEITKEIIGGNLILSKDGTLSTDKMISGTDYIVKIHETPVTLTQEMLDSLVVLDRFIRLSQNGAMSTSQGVLSEYMVEHDLFEKLVRQLKSFKKLQPYYYNSVQAPIEVTI